MNTLKQAWINESGNDVYSLSIESNAIDHNRLKVSEQVFPANNPSRHTMALTYLGIEDLYLLYNTIGSVLELQ